MSRSAELPRMLSIGGSDSCGGAGIQADIKTAAVFGVDGSTVITAITAQNSLGVQAVEPVQPSMIAAQLESVCSDILPRAVKLGMLVNAPTVNAVADAIHRYQLRNIVCDPVLTSTSGRELLDAAGVQALLSLLPHFTLLTPNATEAALLTGREVRDAAGLLAAGRALVDHGARAVLLKGGHLPGDTSTDTLLDLNSPDALCFSGKRIETRNDHGTGCALASAIAANLALGHTLTESIEAARLFVQDALERSVELLNGNGRGGMRLVF